MTSHKGHAHNNTPADRAACRKGHSPVTADTLRAEAVKARKKINPNATVIGRDEAAGVWRWSDGSTSPLDTRFSAGENGVPK